MNPYDSHRPRSKRAALVFLLVLLVAGLAAGLYYLGPRFESQAPQITLNPDSDAVGAGPLEIVISDKGTGLKSIEVKLAAAGGAETTLASEQFAQPVADKTISVASIELFVRAAAHWPLASVLPWLALGPALGLLALRPLVRAVTVQVR